VGEKIKGRKIIGENKDFENIFFYQVTIDKTTGEILKFEVHSPKGGCTDAIVRELDKASISVLETLRKNNIRKHG